jgi:hypothetical protein
MALALVASHNPEVNMWRTTKGFPEFDAAGNAFNYQEPWKEVAGYACKVARLVKTDRKYPLVADPEKPDSEPSSDKDECEDTEKTISGEAALHGDDTADATSAPPM